MQFWGLKFDNIKQNMWTSQKQNNGTKTKTEVKNKKLIFYSFMKFLLFRCSMKHLIVERGDKHFPDLEEFGVLFLHSRTEMKSKFKLPCYLVNAFKYIYPPPRRTGKDFYQHFIILYYIGLMLNYETSNIVELHTLLDLILINLSE